MIKVNKKASTKAIEYCSKQSGRKLGLSTSWEHCFEIAMEGFQISVYTLAQAQGDETVIKLFKEQPQDNEVIETFKFPNEDVYDRKLCDWNWNYIYKYMTEWLMKNLKKLGKSKKTTKQKLNKDEITKQIADLKTLIRNSKGNDKKRAIERYNALSRQLAQCSGPSDDENTNVQESRNEVLKELTPEEIKKEKLRLKSHIRYAKKAGKDTTKFEKELKKYESI